ncbi:MAG: hypothetical protein ABSF69_19215 [Polyangiaceae bacterium]|jgi:hypothetical protein
MMFAESSPATETRSEGRVRPSTSPKTYRATLAIPTTPEEASNLLTRVERIVDKGRVTNELLLDLARFLGANSAAWTPVNRARLRRALAGFDGTAVVDAIVAMIQSHPRTDILDEAELALRGLAPHSASRMRRLVLEPGLDAGVRVCILRAAARLDTSGSAESVRLALSDPETELRDAAIALLAELALPTGRAWLQQRLDRESSAMVQDAIRDALASFPR